MLRELHEKQRAYAEHYFANIDLEPIEKLVELLLERKGVIFFTGVGKSGLVAKKIALTMVSTGTRAYYLSPLDALHGDVGMVSSQDTFIILSKSGESEELISLIPALRNKGAMLVSVVCNPRSRLAAATHSAVVLPFQRELCPYDMAPTTSSSSQLLFGDLLTIALMRRKNFSLDEYALNHPSGRLGKRITLKVQDLMISGDRLPLCRPEDLLKEVIVELSNKRCGCILIADENKRLLGIFTDGDLRRTLQEMGGQVLESPMSALMNSHPSATQPDIFAWEAMKKMEADSNRRFMMLPVINSNHQILGLIHLHDIIQTGL